MDGQPPLHLSFSINRSHRPFLSNVELPVCSATLGSHWNLREDVAAKLTPQAIQARIREHRMGDLIIKAPPGADVWIEPLRHEFWFGTAISNSMVQASFRGLTSAEDLRQYQKVQFPIIR